MDSSLKLEKTESPSRLDSNELDPSVMEQGGGIAVPISNTHGIRDSDAASILRQRTALQHQPGGAANGMRSSSVPNLHQTRRSIPVPPPGPNRRQTTLKAALGEMTVPSRPVGEPPRWRASMRNVATYSWLNVLLIFIPVSWAVHFTHQTPTLVFVFSALAILPLAGLLGFATEELAIRVGDTLGGLLNATFGNAVELIISILALVKGELRVVQSAMLGSILSNCLLVLGMCYFAGGLRFHEQGYGVRAAQLNINLLGISVAAIVIPVGFHVAIDARENTDVSITDQAVLNMSRGIAVILLFVYASYLCFQLWTHAYLYAPPAHGPDDPPPPPALAYIEGPQPPTEGGVFRIPSLPSRWGGSSSSDGSSSVSTLSADENEPKLSMRAAFALLLLVTVVTGFTAEWLVGSIDGLTAGGGVSKEFTALILLPLIGNAAEHVTAVTVATKGKLDLSMAVAVGSSIQISLFVIPFLVLLGWCIGQPLSFYFDPFETLVLFVSIVSVCWAIQDGRTQWLEGMTLMVMYLIIALVFWYYPGLE